MKVPAIVCTERIKIKPLKNLLTHNGMLDKRFPIRQTQDGWIIPIKRADVILEFDGDLVIDVFDFDIPRSLKPVDTIQRKLTEAGIELTECLVRDLPVKWEQYDNFVLLPETAFSSYEWTQLDDTVKQTVLHVVAESIAGKHARMARKSRVPPADPLRRPNIIWLYPELSDHVHTSYVIPNASETSFMPSEDDFNRAYWAHALQNGIHYVWCPDFTMFSQGNITEKTRVIRKEYGQRASFQELETVLDLYAGIGYFSLAYMMNGSISRVIACEWNPWSVEGLKRGCKLNRIEFKESLRRRRSYSLTRSYSHRESFDVKSDEAEFLICSGSNEDYVYQYSQKVDRVNMGLLPSAEQGFPLAALALKGSGGFLHVHQNILEGDETRWAGEFVIKMEYLLMKLRLAKWRVVIRHWERVKSFRPRVWHYVLDVECIPQEI